MYAKSVMVLVQFSALLAAARAEILDINVHHEFKQGETAVLKCASNGDDGHVFMFWHLPKNHAVIGPTNTYDDTKYDYDPISGSLFIMEVSKNDEGIYNCVSEGIEKQDFQVRTVSLRVRMLNHIESNEIKDFKAHAEALRAVISEEIQEEDNTINWILIGTIGGGVLIVLFVTAGVILVFRKKFDLTGNCKRIDFDTESCSRSHAIYKPTTTTECEQLYEIKVQNDETRQTPEEERKLCKEEHQSGVIDV